MQENKKPLYRSCSRCGRVHISGQKCYANSRNYYQHDRNLTKFRNSGVWKRKADEIKQRDKYLCVFCLAQHIYTYKDLSVHHITPLSEDFSKRLDNDNLITVCSQHHRDCEIGKIPRTEQQAIVKKIVYNC